MHYKSVINYFYPSLEDLPYIDYLTCSIAADIFSRVLCLPLYVGIDAEQQLKIVE